MAFVPFNAPLDQWDTSKVINMKGMFFGASSFNQLITMDTSQVTEMSDKFLVMPCRSINRSQWTRQK